MQVRNRLLLNSALSIIAASAVLLVLFISAYYILRAVEKTDIANGIVTGAFERATLRSDYAQSGSERAKAQWFAKNEQVGRLLKSALEKFADPADRKIINELIENNEAIGKLFIAMIENREGATDNNELRRETDLRLRNQYNMRLYDLVLRCRELQNSGRTALFSVIWKAGWWIAGVLVLAMAAAIVNSWTMGRSISRRIKALTRGAAVIGEGNLDHRIYIRGKDELASLSDALNAMTEKLQGSYSDLEREVTDRRRAEEELKKRSMALESANSELESFSYTISHDLRAPLRAIDGFSEMLLKDIGNQLDPESVLKFSVIRSNTEKMNQLIEDLLKFSRSGRAVLSESRTDIQALVLEVWKELKNINPDRNIELKIDSLPPAFCDRSLIRQVLSNLLGNAVKFTRGIEHAVIEVGGSNTGQYNTYFIKDNGSGFDMRHYNKIFEIFSRLHSEKEYEGTGVGLAIVKKIIDKHGGKVWAESKPGKGAAFYFTLPG